LNLIFRLPALNFVFSIFGVLIFIGFIVYDTQKIKQAYYRYQDSYEIEKFAIFSALNLYLDFLNLFLHLLQLFGKKKD
jgi:FtsH-binding integral membrane protein